MAKKAPKAPPPKRPVPAAGGAAAQSDAVGKFDKFGAFALALPCTILALVCLIVAIGYTNSRFDTGLFGIPGKKVVAWDSGTEAVAGTVEPKIEGFESHNYIGRLGEGEIDVAVLNVGSENRVNLGDVFTLTTEQADVRVEFVVFDLQSTTSRAYILLGQNVEGGKARQYSLRRDDMVKLCGAESGIKVKRDWKNQIIRRYVETRSNKS